MGLIRLVVAVVQENSGSFKDDPENVLRMLRRMPPEATVFQVNRALNPLGRVLNPFGQSAESFRPCWCFYQHAFYFIARSLLVFSP